MARSREVFEGKIFSVFTGTRTIPGGRKAHYEEVRHPGAAIVVPFIGKDIIMLRQYRIVLDKYIWELPAGKLDPGETPYACAKREVAEETGFEVKNVRKLGYIYTTPGFCDERIHVYRAVCARYDKTDRDEDEVIRVRRFSPDKVRKMVYKGLVPDAKTVCALTYAGVMR